MKVRQDPPAANGISGTQSGERPRNHSEISDSYGYGHDRLKDCRYKVYGRLANSERGLVLVFDLASAVMFDPLPEEYFDKHTGKMKKRIVKYYPDEIRMKLGRSYSDYEALQQRSSFESLSGYMDTSGGAVPATVSEELAASISMQEQEKKRETLFGTIIGNGGDDDVRNNE